MLSTRISHMEKRILDDGSLFTLLDRGCCWSPTPKQRGIQWVKRKRLHYDSVLTVV